MSLLTTVAHLSDPQVVECFPSPQDSSYLKASYLNPKAVEQFEAAIAQCKAEPNPPKETTGTCQV